MRAFRKWIALLAALCMALGCMAAMAEEAADVLVGEAWVNSGGTKLVLNGDGSAGINYPTMTQEGTWSCEGSHLVIAYQFYGDRTMEYDLEQKEGYWALTTPEGALFMRESEYEAAMAASGDGMNAYAMAMGEEIMLPFVKFTLSEAALVDTVGSDKYWVDSAEGYRFFCIRGTVENLFTQELEFGRARAQFTFNDSYLFSGSLRVLTQGVLTTKLSPMSSGELFIYASVPDELAGSLETASLLLGINDNLATAPMFAPEAEYLFRLDVDEASTAQAMQEPERERVTFAECPALPTPLSYAALYESSHSTGTSNGKVTHIRYGYASHKSGADLSELAGQYLDGLRAEGFGVEEDGGEYTVRHGSDEVATISVESDAIRMELVPGNEGLTDAPTLPAEVAVPTDSAEPAVEAAPAAPAVDREYTDKETIIRVQQELNNAGYDCGKPDGVAGKKTQKAIDAFQEANGLARTGTVTDSLLTALGLNQAPGEAKKPAAPEGKVVDTDAGTLVIKGYSIVPKGFKGFSNTHKYDGYSIFTVHAVLTVKGDEPKSSWSTFKTQAFQNGLDARDYTDFDKKTRLTTDIMPNTPVEIDLDFLVESPDAPITFMVSTWGRSKIVFQEEVNPAELG